MRYHFSRKHVGEIKEIMIHRVESKEHKVDVFTKVLPEETFQYIRKLLAL